MPLKTPHTHIYSYVDLGMFGSRSEAQSARLGLPNTPRLHWGNECSGYDTKGRLGLRND